MHLAAKTQKKKEEKHSLPLNSSSMAQNRNYTTLKTTIMKLKLYHN